MRICQHHWFMLRCQIEDIGLMHLVAKNHAAMMEIVDHSLDGTHFTARHFDPLLMANYVIWENTDIELYGQPICPLCVIEHKGENALKQIKDASNAALQKARTLNLAPSVQ